MKHLSLFSGIGGFDLAAEWMGWKNVAHCEREPFCQRVLNYYWPKAKLHDDIKTADFTIYRGQIDILTGGFPCQPYSTAGKRLGKEDDRHLWPEMLRAIREISPRWIVGENVRGLISWNGGMVFEEVQADLEAEGYEVLPFLLPACAVNAPHRRDRIWFVAYSKSNGNRRGLRGLEEKNGYKQEPEEHGKNNNQSRDDGKVGNVTNANYKGLQGSKIERSSGDQRKKSYKQPFGCIRPNWQNFPTQSPVRSKYDGVSSVMVRNIKSEVYATISENYTNENLQKVRESLQKTEVQREIRGLYKIHEPGILLKTLQLCQAPDQAQGDFSPFGEAASARLMQKLRKYGKFGCSPQGRELEKQFNEQFGNALPFLSHEIALAAKEIQEECERFICWHRNESIKGYGNAVVPQVVLQIFKAIEHYEAI